MLENYRSWTALVLLGLALAAVSWSALSSPETPGRGGPDPTENEALSPVASRAEPIVPVPRRMDEDPRKVDLGRRLFHDERLSSDGTISCATCHVIEEGGADNRRLAVGLGGAVGDLNTPTVLNSGFNFRQFWDGRADSLEAQVEIPLLDPREMGGTWEEVLQVLTHDAGYGRDFVSIYGEISRAAFSDAVASFERSLITPNAPFDLWLLGDDQALSPEAQHGYLQFKNLGCISCHQGVNAGGNMFQRFGVFEDYFEGREVRKADLGRFNITGLERDRHRFKVPGLRNVALTAPYFHDGSAQTLEEAVRVMARIQLGIALSDPDTQAIVLFLESLTGELLFAQHRSELASSPRR